MTTSLFIIALTSSIIYLAGHYFTSASSNIGDYFRLPRSVKGATLDAISSSFPELMIAIFSVLAFKKFEVGIGTIAGSALFNLLIITGISILVAPKAFKVSRELVHRDGVFYIISVAALLIALLISPVWTYVVPLLFILVYLLYLKRIIHDTRQHQVKNLNTKTEIIISREIIIAAITMVVIGFASFYLTEASIQFAEEIKVSPIIIAFTIMAAATSLPDAVISILNARKGSLDDSAANVFGSNIFDILIGLSIPALMAIYFAGPIKMNFQHIEIVIGLLVSTILVIYFMTGNYTLKKGHGYFILAMYGFFFFYVVYLSMN